MIIRKIKYIDQKIKKEHMLTNSWNIWKNITKDGEVTQDHQS